MPNKAQTFSPYELKELLLQIIVCANFIDSLNEELSKLKAKIIEHNKKVRSSWGQGGASSLEKLNQVKIEGLIKNYNSLLQHGYSTETVYKDILYNLGETFSKESEQEKKIKSYTFCKHFLEQKFPSVSAFTFNLHGIYTVFDSIKSFITSEEQLKGCTIKFLGKNEEYEDNIPKISSEYYICHFLSLERKPLLSNVTLQWKGTELIQVYLEQHESFIDNLPPINFTNAKHGIHQTPNDSPVFVILKENISVKRNPAYLQITIENNRSSRQIIMGTYSAIIKHNKKSEPILVSGTAILQAFPEKQNLSEISEWLNQNNPSQNSEIIEQIRFIRYRLFNPVVRPKTGIDDNYTKFKRYVGHYSCYYMRLSKTPIRFEISNINIFPDGSATLQQYGEETETLGFARLNGERLWVYFGYNNQIANYSIRFILDDVDVLASPHLRGVFSSETLIDKRLVTGRMSMRKIADSPSNPIHFSKPIEHVYYNDFVGDDLKFFTGHTNQNLTDGPIWAEISTRLTNYSAIKTITSLCTAQSEEFFSRNKFYYYTFKKDNDNGQFLIERNLVTFHPNGTVTIFASDTTYQGYAYYLKNTLRLSLSDPIGGFLEIFLEILTDTAHLHEVKILYGMSIWRSGTRLQGKTVVLSRFGKPHELSKETEFFCFFDPNSALFEQETKKMQEENALSGGALSYLRGEINRYLHSTTHSSPVLFRPRDASFREMHFLIACYYGYILTLEQHKHTNISLINKCKDHIRQAYIHGYACNFAEISINSHEASNDDDDEYLYISKIYKEKYPEIEVDNQKKNIFKRIKEIAKEQIYLTSAFCDGGPLNHNQLIEYAQKMWPDLVLLS